MQSSAVKLAGIDADGILRGKIISGDKYQSILSSGFGFCSVIFGWDMHDRTYTKELAISSMANGYRDMLAVVDADSVRKMPWEDNVPLALVYFLDPDTRQPIPTCPRGMLKAVCQKIQLTLQATPMAGCEFEFIHYKETAASVAQKHGQGLDPLTTGMFGYSLQRPVLNKEYYYRILDTCAKFDCPLEGWHTETGPGIYEAALAYTKAEDLADRAALFKLVCKCIAPEYGILPSFMAKPAEGMPGNSGHMHLSLVDDHGKNLFARETPDPHAPWPDAEYLSDMGRHFLAGILEGLPDIMPLLAPNINSYKRLVENFWAPVTVSWGLEHRIASVRVIAPPTCAAKATRFEIRVPGADVHTHYALSALFALGARGVNKRLAIPVPPMPKALTPETMASYERLPRSLQEATDRFAAPDSLARQVLGNAFVDHFASTRYEEIALWNNAVTNWEVMRYVETA